MELSMERRAGQHVRRWTRKTALWGLAAIGGVLLVGGFVGVAAGFTSWTFIAAELAVLLALVAINRCVVPVVERRDRGATGEEHVGAILDALAPQGWRVLHDVDTGRGNIDHVVVGPTGVFTVETKSYGGCLDVDRIDDRMWKQAYAQAKHVERATGAKVTPLLVFSRAYLSEAPARRRGVIALPARMLEGNLRRARGSLSPAEIERLTGALLSR
jgi:hypothetical protein